LLIVKSQIALIRYPLRSSTKRFSCKTH